MTALPRHWGGQVCAQEIQYDSRPEGTRPPRAEAIPADCNTLPLPPLPSVAG